MNKEWKILSRLSYLGKKRDSFIEEMNTKYGKGNWRFVWKIEDRYLQFKQAIMLYEVSYFIKIYEENNAWRKTFLKYRECYDNAISNIKSGLDYEIQESSSNHYQDISVRRVMFSLGLHFGNTSLPLMQIRHKSTDDGYLLSPGYMKFHLPYLIEKSDSTGWWEPDSVESFWQSNKFIQTRDNI